MKNRFTILLILFGLFIAEAPSKAEVFHPSRVYPTSGSNAKAAGQKKKHWWQRKETPERRAKQRAKMMKKKRKENVARARYDAKQNSPLPN